MNPDRAALSNLEAWARASGVDVLQPCDYARTPGIGPKDIQSLDEVHPFPQSPCVDFGRFIEKTPSLVMRPDSVAKLRACAVSLQDRRIPFKVRGGGHSSGGQVLIDRGVVIDITGLCAIVKFDPAAERLSIQGGATWWDVVTTLRQFNRIPVVWTDNLKTTVAGTLAVGGFGDTTSRYGLQIDNVTALRVLTLDGSLHEVRPGDSLFEYSLAGRGQLGVIVEASIRTLRRQFRSIGMRIRWHEIQDFVDDMKLMIEESSHDVFRVRASLAAGGIEAFVGDLFGGGTIGSGPWPKRGSPMQVVDVDFHTEIARLLDSSWTKCCVPALEFALPLDSGLRVWSSIQRSLAATDVTRYFFEGSTRISVLRGRSDHPLAPLPGSDFSLMVPLRPRVPLGDVPRVLGILRGIATQVLNGGGRIYGMSVDTGIPGSLDRQLRGHYQRFVDLKRQYDPGGLLNPGLLETSP